MVSPPNAAEFLLKTRETSPYACGFVAHSLLKKFEKQKGQKYALFVDCLGEIAVAGDGENILEYTRTWFDIVNRGGLFSLKTMPSLYSLR